MACERPLSRLGGPCEERQRRVTGGQVVVITGASGGVGRATARAFGAMGASVGLLARGEAGLAGALKDVENVGGRALAIPTDTADFDQVAAAAKRVEAELGPIDVWINVAFTSVFAPFARSTPEEFRRVTEVTYLGYVSTGPGRRCAACSPRPRRSSRSARRWPTGASRCSRRTAGRSTPSRASTSRCGASCCTTGANVHATMVQLPAVNTPQFGWVLNRLGPRAMHGCHRRSTNRRS